MFYESELLHFTLLVQMKSTNLKLWKIIGCVGQYKSSFTRENLLEWLITPLPPQKN